MSIHKILWNFFSNNGTQGLNSGSILHAASENHNWNSSKITCTYCRQNHPSNRCRVVTDVFARKKILQDKSKCYNCLKTGHSVKNCTSQHRCFACKRKHHISICESKINPVKKDNSSENQAPQNEIINSKDNNESSSSSSPTILLIDHSSKKWPFLNCTSFNPIQDGLFWGCSRMWGTFLGPNSLKSVTHILQWWNLAQLYLTSGRSKNIQITWHIPLVLLTSAFFHQKSAKFATSRNKDIDWILIHNF